MKHNTTILKSSTALVSSTGPYKSRPNIRTVQLTNQTTDTTGMTKDRVRAATLPTYVFKLARQNGVLVLLLLLLIALTPLQADKIKDVVDYYKLVEWNAVGALTGILIITTGIRESNFLNRAARRILRSPMSERQLASLLVALSVLLSPLLTNDITLFIIVPLTMNLQAYLKRDITKIVVFEAIAVNIGSALTPIGNPQNLFLWHEWGLSFTAFVIRMAPLIATSALLLLLTVRFSFGEQKFKAGSYVNERCNEGLLALSIVLLCGYMVALELKLIAYALLIITLAYALLYRDVLERVDWPVILIFILMFIDFGLISRFALVAQLMEHLNQASTGGVFAYALLASQFISNVPAAVLVSRFSDNWLAIAYGVNVGGNGVVIASLANLIALRIVGSRGIWLTFHKYSLIYLSLSASLIYLALHLHPVS